jgi:hypothetical protein
MKNYTNMNIDNPFVGNELDYLIRNEYYLNVHNIINKYNPDNPFKYIIDLFNKDEIAKEMYLEYCIGSNNCNIIIQILPFCTAFMSQYPSGSKIMETIIQNKEWYKLFSLYAMSIGRHFTSMYKTRLDICYYYYYNTIFNIAINKLKRNLIVQNGIILKILINQCGMFD